MKVTIIGHDRVYPPISADAQRFFHLSKHLSKDFNVVLMGHSGMITRFKKYRINENFNIIEIPGRIAMALGALGYLLTKKPLFDLILAFGCKTFPKMVKTYLKHANDSDILIFEGCWHFQLLTEVKNLAQKLIVYDARNIEYLLKKQAYSGAYKRLLPRMFELEKGLCQESDLILTTCEEEKERFAELYSLDRSKLKVTPPGMVVPKEGRRPERKTVLFIGGAYFANFEAAKLINSELAEKLPEFKFRIIGRASMAVKKKAKNVELYGFISEAEKDKLLRTSELAINPIKHGAGVNVKMLEYMAYDMPIVTTSLGARGIEYDKKSFIISELEDFDGAIKSLSANPKLMKELGKNARETIIKKYEWSVVTKGVAKLLLEEYGKKKICKQNIYSQKAQLKARK